jgi:hypothetical protein
VRELKLGVPTGFAVVTVVTTRLVSVQVIRAHSDSSQTSLAIAGYAAIDRLERQAATVRQLRGHCRAMGNAWVTVMGSSQS